jgi:hypothetical protein
VAIVKAACVRENFKTGGAVPATPDGSSLEQTTTMSAAACLWNRLANCFLKPEEAIPI